MNNCTWDKDEVLKAIRELSNIRANCGSWYEGEEESNKYYACCLAIRALREVIGEQKSNFAEVYHMKNNYPNLMCFGNEPHKCDCQDSCLNYVECEKRYHEVWISFMETRHIKE